VLLCACVLSGYVASLKVGPVTLRGTQKYINAGSRPSANVSRIYCHYTLDDDQEVSSVLWEILKEEHTAGTYEWSLDQDGNVTRTVTGLLEGSVYLHRDDGDLQLTEIRYDLGANYTCTVTTTDGTNGSAREEVLVVDTITSSIDVKMYDYEANCSVIFSEKYYPVFPDPTVIGGLYSPSLDQYHELIDWDAIHHQGGTVEYFTKDHVFKIDRDTPVDVMIKSSIGITKANGSYIGFGEGGVYFYFSRSCDPLVVGENQTVTYSNDYETCYGEPLGGAKVTCADGFKVNSTEYSFITLRCRRQGHNDYQWEPSSYPGLMPEELYCVAGGTTATVSYTVSLVALLVFLFYQ